jgi:ATP-dependent helicase/nuclease subunit A
MTRAADRLIICGADGERRRPDGCWYDLVRAALGPQLAQESDCGETVWRFRQGRAAPITATHSAPDQGEQPDTPAAAVPSWLRQAAPMRPPQVTPLAPSATFAEEIGAAMAGTARDRQMALQRGQVVHRLMQSLPDIAPTARKSALEHYLGNAARELSPEQRADITRHVFAILEDDRFAEVFAAGSRPEVPVVGRIPRPSGQPVPVAGQVDRLLVTKEAVLVADYKTDSLVPSHLDEVPNAYVAQLSLYRAVLMRIYPDKRVRAALIFTAAPVLMEIPAAILDRALESQLERYGRSPVTPR